MTRYLTVSNAVPVQSVLPELNHPTVRQNALWRSSDARAWFLYCSHHRSILSTYAKLGSKLMSHRLNLLQLDEWAWTVFAPAIRARRYMTRDELVSLANLKGLRRAPQATYGIHRLMSNSEALVIDLSRKAFAHLDRHELEPALTELTKLFGVGPATASFIMSFYAPHVAPFMSDEVTRFVTGRLIVSYKASVYYTIVAYLRRKLLQLQSLGVSVIVTPPWLTLTSSTSSAPSTTSTSSTSTSSTSSSSTSSSSTSTSTLTSAPEPELESMRLSNAYDYYLFLQTNGTPLDKPLGPLTIADLELAIWCWTRANAINLPIYDDAPPLVASAPPSPPYTATSTTTNSCPSPRAATSSDDGNGNGDDDGEWILPSSLPRSPSPEPEQILLAYSSESSDESDEEFLRLGSKRRRSKTEHASPTSTNTTSSSSNGASHPAKRRAR